MKLISTHFLPSALVALLALGCGTSVAPEDGIPGDDTNDPNNPNNPGNPGDPLVPEACTKMDIVFVVDDSGSMSEEQTNLGQNFPAFFDVIDNFVNEDGVPVDYRIAVTTTGRDVDYTIKVPPPFSVSLPQSESGDNGAFRTTSGMSNPWLSRGDSNIKSTFQTLANVGTGGPSLEMPLYTTELAFTDRMKDGTNNGFLRDDSLLALVILTDEDDCSRKDNNFEIESDACEPNDPTFLAVDQQIKFLNNVSGGSGRWATAVIAGPDNCESSFGSAYAANRLQNFVAGAGANGVFSSICEGDLASALQDALYTFDSACNAFPPVE